jgi:hypothetical protein
MILSLFAQNCQKSPGFYAPGECFLVDASRNASAPGDILYQVNASEIIPGKECVMLKGIRVKARLPPYIIFFCVNSWGAFPFHLVPLEKKPYRKKLYGSIEFLPGEALQGKRILKTEMQKRKVPGSRFLFPHSWRHPSVRIYNPSSRHTRYDF